MLLLCLTTFNVSIPLAGWGQLSSARHLKPLSISSQSLLPKHPMLQPIVPLTMACSNLSLSLFMLFFLKCSFPTSLSNVTPSIKLSLKLQPQAHPAEPFYSLSCLPYSTNYTVLKSHRLYVNHSYWIGHTLRGGPQETNIWKVCIKHLLLCTRRDVHYSSSAVTSGYLFDWPYG